MPVIVDQDHHRATVIGSLLGSNNQIATSVDQLHRWLSRRHAEYVVILGPEVGLSEAIVVADQLRLTRPALSVVLLRDAVDTQIMSQALKAGVRDVVTVGDTQALQDAVVRARQVFEAINGPTVDSPGRVVTVFSPKGGVGKTTIAVNLAHALTDDGNQTVCLVDLDLAFGDLAITMQLIPEHTIAEAAQVDEVDASMLEDLLTKTSSNLSILAAPTQPDAKESVTPLVVKRVLTALRTKFDVVVVDTAPGFDEEVLQAFDDTDECVVVATLDVPTIKNVKMAMETLDLLDLVPGHRHLVLNRANDNVGLTAENVESILGVPVAVRIPYSNDVAKATNYGEPIMVSQPTHVVSQAIREIGALVIPRDEALDDPSPKGRRRGLFRRAS